MSLLKVVKYEIVRYNLLQYKEKKLYRLKASLTLGVCLDEKFWRRGNHLFFFSFLKLGH